MWELGDPIFGEINLNELRPDQAYLNVTSKSTDRFWLYSLSEDCFRCPFLKWRDVAPMRNLLLKFDTSRRQHWKVFDNDVGPYAFNNETALFYIQPDVGQFGVYNLICDNDDCEFSEAKRAVSIYLSLMYFILLAVGTTFLVYFSNYCYKKYKESRMLPVQSASTDEGKITDNELNKPRDKPKLPKPRLRSLDTFRGIAIVLMIFVNSGGGHYWWMEHATWNGLHVADLVFPWFLWIMGVCIPISIKSQLSRNVSKRTMILNIFIRSVKLFLIGLCLNTASGPPLEQIRIMGVLQRFGISYFVVASLHTIVTKPITALPQGRVQRALYDITQLGWQWLVMLLLVFVHLSISFAFPVPGCPRGYFGPGGRHEMLAQPNCTGGATGYIDNLILSKNHMYQRGAARKTYDSRTFDPEGIYGCLLTVVHVFLGLQAGNILMVHPEWTARTKRWLYWGFAACLCGGVLCAFSQDDGETGLIPINKQMWSLSFVLVTCGLAFVLLSLCYFLIDVRGLWSGTPLIYAGMNAILMYIGHTIMHQILPFRWYIGPMNTHFVLLVQNAWNAMMWMFIAYYLHCKKIYFSV